MRALAHMGEANLDVFDLWLSVKDQWRTSFSGPVAIDLSAVLDTAGVLGIGVNAGVVKKILALAGVTLRSVSEQADKEKRVGRKRDVKR